MEFGGEKWYLWQIDLKPYGILIALKVFIIFPAEYCSIILLHLLLNVFCPFQFLVIKKHIFNQILISS